MYAFILVVISEKNLNIIFYFFVMLAFLLLRGIEFCKEFDVLPPEFVSSSLKPCCNLARILSVKRSSSVCNDFWLMFGALSLFDHTSSQFQLFILKSFIIIFL